MVFTVLFYIKISAAEYEDGDQLYGISAKSFKKFWKYV